jgi:hypothetical protein
MSGDEAYDITNDESRSRAIPNIIHSGYIDDSGHRLNSVRDRFNSVRSKRIVKMMELEKAESGGLIDRSSKAKRIDLTELGERLRENALMTNTSLIGLIQDIHEEAMEEGRLGENTRGKRDRSSRNWRKSSLSSQYTPNLSAALYLTWKDVTFEVVEKGKSKDEPTKILNGLSGEAKPG